MALLTVVESALKLGYSVELLQYFIKRCPKRGEDRKLECTKVANQVMIEEKELLDFQRYLNLPWPKPESGDRPGIPEPIRDDIRQESHFACAVCGHMDNGEIAHIESVVETLNNSPDNLVYLCPNHHSKYDYGFELRSNVTIEEVRAAKRLKRMSRQRMMRCEANATKSLHGLIRMIKSIEQKVKNEDNKVLVTIHITEATTLLKLIPQLTDDAVKQAKKDQSSSPIDKIVAKNAPAFAKIALGASEADHKGIRTRMASVIDRSNEILIEIDEVECPHCAGTGMVGLVGDFCKYCKGDCVVTEEESESYDRNDIDEVECPHCEGSGTTGLNQLLCKYCRGSCVVSEEEGESYDRNDIDEVECPHCNGRGRYGFRDLQCAYCRGDCVITEEEFEAYDANDIDEVDCPHCNGNGCYGLRDTVCAYCRGDRVVTKEELQEYDANDIDEVECPHCNGRGTTGRNQSTCANCRGDGFVTSEEKEDYDPSDIDEVECPHCNGRGTTGLRDSSCKLCDGDCTVSQEKRQAYQEQYGR